MEKQKITAEDLMAATEPPAMLVQESAGVYNFRYAESVDIVEQMRFVCLKYNQMAKDQGSVLRIIPTDFMVKVNKDIKTLVIKKSGKFKIAQLFGFKNSMPKILEKNQNYVLVQAQVFFEGNDMPFTDIGYCGKDEKGKDWWDFTTLLGTAVTRAILRAISQYVVVDLMDEAEYEQMAQNVENQIDAQDLRKVQKIIEQEEKKKEIKTTQQEEAKLQTAELTANRKFAHFAKTTKKAKADDELLASLEAEANELTGADQ